MSRSVEEIQGAKTVRRMIVQISGCDYACEVKDALLLLESMSRMVRVQKEYSPNYAVSIYVPTEDQNPPITGADVGDVEIPEKGTLASDIFFAATRQVSA